MNSKQIMLDDMDESMARVSHSTEGLLAGTQLLPREAAKLVLGAGWLNYNKVLTAIQIFYAESLCFTEAVGGPNPDGTFDYGWVQLNSGHMKAWGYTNLDEFKAMAFDPTQAIAKARALYVAAEYDFTPWAAFTNGHYDNPVFRVRAIQGVANGTAELDGTTPVPKFATRG